MVTDTSLPASIFFSSGLRQTVDQLMDIHLKKCGFSGLIFPNSPETVVKNPAFRQIPAEIPGIFRLIPSK
jgi:hypothetical protein